MLEKGNTTPKNGVNLSNSTLDCLFLGDKPLPLHDKTKKNELCTI